MHAAYRGRDATVRLLLDGGADISIQDNVRMREKGREGGNWGSMMYVLNMNIWLGLG
jgi:hypothetical protein